MHDHGRNPAVMGGNDQGRALQFRGLQQQGNGRGRRLIVEAGRGLIGQDELRQIGLTIEQAGKAGDAATVQAQLPRLVELLRELGVG